MKRFCVAAILLLAIGAVLSAQGTPTSPAGPKTSPDLSGRWNRESVTGDAGAVGASTWGARIQIDQSAGQVSVRPDAGKAEQHKLDGTETAEVLSVDGCKNQTRITKWVAERDRVTITTWLATKAGCFHGEFEDEPFVFRTGSVELREVRGTRKLESITVVFRQGDVLTIDSTRAAAGGGTTNTTTTYRK